MFLELCKDFVYFLSSESDLIGVCSCFSREAGAKWAFLCYNERSIKNGEKRVKRAVEKFDIDFEAWSLKPFTFGIDRALKRFHYEKNEVVMVGDQLMTDIRAAHRAGIRSILVKPLVEHDSIKTQINRARERRVMKQMAEKYGPIEYKKGI